MLESLIDEAHTSGWYIYAIHECEDFTRRDRWQVTLRKVIGEEMYVAHGQGRELADAFEMALSAAPQTCTEKVSYTIDRTCATDVLKRLTKQPNITRRMI